MWSDCFTNSSIYPALDEFLKSNDDIKAESAVSPKAVCLKEQELEKEDYSEW